MASRSQQLETTEGTVFGAYNAVTGFFQNVKSFKDDEAKFKSLVCGGSGQLKGQRCFQLWNSINREHISFSCRSQLGSCFWLESISCSVNCMQNPKHNMVEDRVLP
ncbi:MAG: DUF932 domain-containing protein [Chitinophagaceae bacterium]